MMKFFIFMLLGWAGVGLIKGGVWLLSGMIILGCVLFTSELFFFVDYIFYSLYMGMDMVSFSLIMLSLWVTVLMYQSSNSVYFGWGWGYFCFFVFALMLVLMITFVVVNLFSFYFFFEFSLIPTLCIILGWGYQPERVQAGIYFIFYTLGASLPLLVGVVYFYNEGGSLDFFLLGVSMNLKLISGVLFFMLTMAFMVKMPMFMFHLWLPKAHVEAPVSGSMILAGVLLKLGGYGLYRVLFLVDSGGVVYGGYFFGLSVAGMAVVGFNCLRLVDLKALVAYSSVAHMGLVISGIMSFYYWGFNGALIMMIGHGVCSSGLFCGVNMYYGRSGSRAFMMNKGLISTLSVFTLLMFLLCAANMAAPPTVNLLAEISLMGSMLKFDFLMLMLFPLGSYLGAVFTLFMFSYSQHGRGHEGGVSFWVSDFREFNLLAVHSIPLNILFLNYDFFLNMY